MARTTFALATLLLLAGCKNSISHKESPLTPKDSLEAIQLDPAWHVDLFASEPLFADPVAMDIDEDGRIYVVQNSGYPLDTEHAVGKVWLLEDTDGDGKPDKSTAFADKLILPTGVMRWKKGVIVTDAPNVWYMEDTDGDGKADVKRVLLTGFAFTNPQHTVNSPTYGLDNWIYLAHEGFANAVVFAEKFGDKGSEIHFADRPKPSVKNERRNVCFRPGSFQLETTSSTSQFGLTFDDYGHLLTVNNSNHARAEMIAARYLARNPDLLAGSSMQDTSDHGTAAQVFFTVKNPRLELLSGAGVFTSACSITWFQGGTLVAEPVHSLVHRDIWTPAGSTFVAKRAKENVEFLTSTDSWFRPVNFYLGPDGALYAIDYYRKVIEHPEWTSREVYEAKDIYDGKDLGRIYRITPAGSRAATPARPRLSQASDAELVSYLERPEIWWRRTAQRLLVDRQSEKAVEPLRRLALEGKSPLGRLHALWTLDGLGRLDAPLVEKALGDREAGVRENAIILAESRIAQGKLTAALLEMEKDGDARVRFQLLATLGSVHTPAAAQIRKRLLDRDMEDRWVQTAALSASSDEALPALEAAIASHDANTPGRASYFQQLGSVVGARGKAAELAKVLDMAAAASGSKDAEWWRAAQLEGLASGLHARHATLAAQPALLRLYDGDAASVRRAALHLIEISGLPPGAGAALAKAAATALDRQRPGDLRADAISLLALAPAGKPVDFYQKFIEPGEPEEVQSAAVRALGKQKGIEPARFLLARWRSLTPSVRSEAGSALVSDSERFQLLLGAIDKGDIQSWSLPLRQRLQMQMYRDPALRERARSLFADKAGNREDAVKRYRAVLDNTTGDPSQGRATFEKVCSKCHKLNGVGSEVGPDLATVRNRTPDAMLTDILIPSRSIAQMYEAYVVETTSSGILEGVIGEQTSTTITLVHEQGKKDVIPRSEIKQMYVANLSAMPEDIDKEVTPGQMANLIAYLRKPN